MEAIGHLPPIEPKMADRDETKLVGVTYRMLRTQDDLSFSLYLQRFDWNSGIPFLFYHRRDPSCSYLSGGALLALLSIQTEPSQHAAHQPGTSCTLTHPRLFLGADPIPAPAILDLGPRTARSNAHEPGPFAARFAERSKRNDKPSYINL